MRGAISMDEVLPVTDNDDSFMFQDHDDLSLVEGAVSMPAVLTVEE